MVFSIAFATYEVGMKTGMLKEVRNTCRLDYEVINKHNKVARIARVYKHSKKNIKIQIRHKASKSILAMVYFFVGVFELMLTHMKCFLFIWRGAL